MISKRSTKRTLSLLLVLCMLLSLCPVNVFAETALPTKNYISFGDSMTNGLGHDKYKSQNGDGNTNGFRQNDVETVYPYMLKEYLADPNGDEVADYKVNYEQMAISAMRPQDINFLLRFETDNEIWKGTVKTFSTGSWNKTNWDNTFIDNNGHVIGDYYTWADFVHFRFKDWGTDGGISDSGKSNDSEKYDWEGNGPLAYAKFYQDQVKNADVITLGVGNATLCVNLLQNMMGALGIMDYRFEAEAFPADELLASRVDPQVFPYLQKALNEVKKVAEDYVGGLDLLADGVTTDEVIDCIVYTFAGFFISYWDMLEAIDELHASGDKKDENLDIIELGMINTMRNLKLDLGGGQSFDFGGMLTAVMDVLSAYYFTVPVLCQEFTDKFENITFYIAPVTKDIDLLTTNMHGNEGNGYNGIAVNSVLRDRTIKEVNEMGDGMIVGMMKTLIEEKLGDDLGLSFGTISAENAGRYETLKESYSTWKGNGYSKAAPSVEGLTMPNALASAVYLALEKAIAWNAGKTTIDMASLMSLMGGGEGLGGAFSGIGDALDMDALQQEVEEQVAAAVTAAAQEPALDVLQVTQLSTITELENALADALCGDKTLGDLLGLLALCIINNGMGVHPSEKGHETLFREIMEVYPDTVAKDKLGELAQEYGAKLLTFLKENGADALKQVVGIAEQMRWLRAEDAQLINDQIDKANEAIQSGDSRKMLAYCMQLAEMLFTYAKENPEEIQALLDTVMPYVEELGAKLYDLVCKYGADALTNLVELLGDNNVIKGTQADLLKQIISVCDEAFKSDNAGKVRECCGEVAALLYQYAVNEGYVPPVMQATITLSARVFGRVQERVQTTAKVLQYINQRRMQTFAAIERIIENFIERRNAYRMGIPSAFGMPMWAPWTSMPLLKAPAAEGLVVEEPIVEEPAIEGPVVEEPVVEEPIVEEPVIEEPVVQGTEDEIELTVNVKTETGRLLLRKWTKYTVQLLAESTGDTLHVTSVQYSTNNRTWKTGTKFTTTEKPNKIYVRVWDDCGGMTSFTYANGTVTKN